MPRRADDDDHGPFTSVHANYWLSGLSGHVIKHELNLPLVCTFHTLDRVKAEAMPEEVEADMPHRRAEAEASIIHCSDAVLASCTVEAEQIASLYGADPARIRIVPPGVDHAFFGPGHRPQARRALGLPLDGRAPPLRRADPAAQVRRRAPSRRWPNCCERGGEPYRLVVVGGPSGPHGEKSLQGLLDLADGRGVRERVHFVDPSPTNCFPRTTGPPTCAWCRAAPSRSGWSPWRPRPAAPRSWPRLSAA